MIEVRRDDREPRSSVRRSHGTQSYACGPADAVPILAHGLAELRVVILGASADAEEHVGRSSVDEMDRRSMEPQIEDLDISTPTIHPTAIAEPGAIVGEGTRIWHGSHLRAGCRIGRDCTIGFVVYVDTGVRIGDRCKIQNHVSLYRGVTLEDDVFVGPSATFTNDRFPRADSPTWDVVPTHVASGASIGANATIVCGVRIGSRAMIAAGAVVTADVPAHVLVRGVPARPHAWVCRCGRPLGGLDETLPDRCPHCGWETASIPR